MPTVFADGSCAKPDFIFKGTRMPYRVVDRSGMPFTETIGDCLPRFSHVFLREEGGGIDKRIFIRWASLFVEEVRDLTLNDRKVLLLYDGYRSHMPYEALKILDDGNVIAFALPAHTSGTTQPLDVGIFGPYKANINRLLLETCSTVDNTVYDVFDLSRILKEAYVLSFSVQNICHAFAKCGLCPLDPDFQSLFQNNAIGF